MAGIEPVVATACAAEEVVSGTLLTANDERRTAHHAFLQWNAIIAVAGNVSEQPIGVEREEVASERCVELASEPRRDGAL